MPVTCGRARRSATTRASARATRGGWPRWSRWLSRARFHGGTGSRRFLSRSQQPLPPQHQHAKHGGERREPDAVKVEGLPQGEDVAPDEQVERTSKEAKAQHGPQVARERHKSRAESLHRAATSAAPPVSKTTATRAVRGPHQLLHAHHGKEPEEEQIVPGPHAMPKGGDGKGAKDGGGRGNGSDKAQTPYEPESGKRRKWGGNPNTEDYSGCFGCGS